MVARILEAGFPDRLLDDSWMLRDDEITRISLAVATALRSARESAGISKNALAQKAGVAVQTVAFVEGGVNSPSITTFLRLCAALVIEPEKILADARMH